MSQENVEIVRRAYEALNTGEYTASFENFQLVAEEFFETGDRVVAFLRQSGRGRTSGIEIETHFAHALTLRGGKVRRVEAFPDREKQAVLEAVGLRSR
jgi:ketosteroid isomerase-like protein